MADEMGESNKSRVLAWLTEESSKSEDGIVMGIYPKMREALNLNDQQIRKAIDELVSEGKVQKEGLGVNTRWKVVSVEEPPPPPPPPADIQKEPEDEDLPPNLLNDELVARIDQEINRAKELIASLKQDRAVIIGAEAARARASQLPPVSSGQ